jgi:hypothetical protein
VNVGVKVGVTVEVAVGGGPTTIKPDVPVMLGVTVSWTVIFQEPWAFKVTAKVRVPLSEAWKV